MAFDTRFVPGDVLLALNPMRTWESDSVRGSNGRYLEKGAVVLVLNTWIVGNQLRLRIIHNDHVMLVSCAEHAAHKNWKSV